MRALTQRTLRAAILGALVAGGLGLAACEPPPGSGATTTPPAANDTDSHIGSVSFQLTLASGYQFTQMSYDISGNGFHTAGTANITNSSTFSTVVSGIPAASGYTATLKTQDTGQKLMTCQGSAMFAITGGATTAAPIHMTCHETANPPSVPVPPGAVFALGGTLLALGATRVRRTAAR
jgi:hypothetical protein